MLLTHSWEDPKRKRIHFVRINFLVFCYLCKCQFSVTCVVSQWNGVGTSFDCYDDIACR